MPLNDKLTVKQQERRHDGPNGTFQSVTFQGGPPLSRGLGQCTSCTGLCCSTSLLQGAQCTPAVRKALCCARRLSDCFLLVGLDWTNWIPGSHCGPTLAGRLPTHLHHSAQCTLLGTRGVSQKCWGFVFHGITIKWYKPCMVLTNWKNGDLLWKIHNFTTKIFINLKFSLTSSQKLLFFLL